MEGTFYEDIGYIGNPPTEQEVGKTTNHLATKLAAALISAAGEQPVDEANIGRIRKREQKIVNSAIDIAPFWATEIINQNHQIIQRIDIQRDQINNLIERVDGQTGQINNLIERVDGQTGQINNLIERVDGQTGQINNLIGQNNEQRDQIDQLIGQINQLENQNKKNHQMMSLANARLFNSKMSRNDSIKFPVKYNKNDDGILTDLKERNQFMTGGNRTIARFFKLRGSILNEILDYYNLPIVQLVDDKKLSISRYLQFSSDK